MCFYIDYLSHAFASWVCKKAANCYLCWVFLHILVVNIVLNCWIEMLPFIVDEKEKEFGMLLYSVWWRKGSFQPWSLKWPCVCVVSVCEGSPVFPGSLMTSGDLSSLSPTHRSGCSCGTLRGRSASGASSPVTSGTPPWPWSSMTSQVSQSLDSSPCSLIGRVQLISWCTFSFFKAVFNSVCLGRHELLPANIKVDRGRADRERKWCHHHAGRQ